MSKKLKLLLSALLVLSFILGIVFSQTIGKETEMLGKVTNPTTISKEDSEKNLLETALNFKLTGSSVITYNFN